MNDNKFKDPLFIIGNPRSGTTLLRLILTSHSKILVPPECGFIIWLHTKYANWRRSDNNNPVILKTFLDELLASKKFDTWMLDRNSLEAHIALHQPECYAQLCKIVYGAYGMSISKSFDIWGDKNNFHINHLDELIEIYQKAKFLHIVRDGRDVACSYREVMKEKSKSPYAPKLVTGISDIATEWLNNVEKVDAFISLLPSDTAMTIMYEDLVHNSLSSVKTICEWLALPFEANMLSFYQQNVSKKLEPEITMGWKKRTVQPISDDTVGRYVRLLTSKEQDEFLAVASKGLNRFSYV